MSCLIRTVKFIWSVRLLCDKISPENQLILFVSCITRVSPKLSLFSLHLVWQDCHCYLVCSILVWQKYFWKLVNIVYLLCNKSSIWNNLRIFVSCLTRTVKFIWSFWLLYDKLSRKLKIFVRPLYNKSITQIKFALIASCMTRLPWLFGLFDSCVTEALLISCVTRPVLGCIYVPLPAEYLGCTGNNYLIIKTNCKLIKTLLVKTLVFQFSLLLRLVLQSYWASHCTRGIVETFWLTRKRNTKVGTFLETAI